MVEGTGRGAATEATEGGAGGLRRLGEAAGDLACSVLLALETGGPTRSVQDRVARRRVHGALASGELASGVTLIESGSGDLGVALAAAIAGTGARLLFVTDDRQSREKVDAARARGAEVVVCPSAVPGGDPRSRGAVAQRLFEETPRSHYPASEETGLAREVYAEEVAPALLEATDGDLTHVFCPVTTGAAVSGLGAFLKGERPDLQIFAVEPEGSAAHPFWEAGRFEQELGELLLEEIGCDQPPSALDLEAIDEVVQVAPVSVIRLARRVARSTGLLLGTAGATVVAAALATARERGWGAEATLVCLCPDDGARYLSKLYNDRWVQEHRLLEDPLERTAARLCARKREENGIPGLLAVAPHSLVIEAVELMKQYGISQIPVVEGEAVLGSVKEDRLIHLLLADQDAKSKPVQAVLDAPFPVVAPSMRVEDLLGLLTVDNPAVLVRMEDGLDILTKADLIKGFSR